MTRISKLFVHFLIASGVAASGSWNTTCTTKSQRKAWNNMSDDEKSAYIEAELCLMNRPAKTGIQGAQNRWDELDWAHIAQTNVIQDVSECGYKGGQPYWNEVLDMDALNESVVFDPNTGFGGQGDDCVTDGPYVNLTLHINSTSTSASDCLSRGFNPTGFQGGVQENVDICFNTATYDEAFECYMDSPHSAGHSGIGGIMQDVAGSPGEPLFYMHHTYLDRLWWLWQEADLPTRLTDMGGRNVPSEEYLERRQFEYPSAAFLDYDGDDSNITTLNHNLWMAGIVPNATIAEVMDIGSNLNCAEYV